VVPAKLVRDFGMSDQSSIFEFTPEDSSEPVTENASEEEELPGEPVALSVAGAVDLINDQLFRIAGPSLMVEGEVSEYAVSQGKWVRFTLKDLDGGAILKCFLTIYQLNVDIQDGDRVVIQTTPKIYPRYGQFTLNVNHIEHAGQGGLKAAFERLRKQFESEGLFDDARKRPLPALPSKIGLITSREAAACTDFIRILENRWGGIDVDLAHVHVQGARAVPEICAALLHFNELPEAERPEVLVLTRGGGGLEDLMAFNAEAVVRAVFASTIPIVVGIGHERDESLAELAADVRASTPSNAAERLVPERESVLREIDMYVDRLRMRVEERITERSHAVERAVSRMQSVVQEFRFGMMQAVSVVENMGSRMLQDVAQRLERVESLARLIKQLDPQHVLKRGYSIVRKGNKVVKKASILDKGDSIQVQLAEGTIIADIV
jgi:exodeoxyribonuclease VII large subunit